MPLVYLPTAEALFSWGNEPVPAELAGLEHAAEPHSALLVTPDGPREVHGRKLPILASVTLLAAVPAAAVARLAASLGSWVLASKLAIDLASRERIIPTITRKQGGIEARWAAALSAAEDAAKVAALARSMPPSAHAVPVPAGGPREVWAPDALLRAYLDAVVDALVRSARGGPELLPRPPAEKDRGGTPANAIAASWDERFRAALEAQEPSFATRGFAERSVLDAIERWSEPALGARDRLRACFRLELPASDAEAFVLRFLLQSPDDPSLMVPAAEVWKAKGRSLESLGRAFRDPQESLLEALGRAARLFAPIERVLASPRPESLELDPATAWAFLADAAGALVDAGFGVIVPSELTAAGQRRLRLRMRVGGKSKVAGAVSGAAALGLDELLAVDWQAVIGSEALTSQELAALAEQKAPLVRHRGAWVAIDPRELGDIQKRIAGGPTRMTLRDSVQAALAGETRDGQLSVAVTASGSLATLIERLSQSGLGELPAPSTLRAQLRKYQERGLGWLVTMASLGLGACLADDMGLGQTI
ncbi:MAG TPA: SNF2 helicase-associated domain-containing protein, partial [Polyangiaceae bacterium]|nr:SNF2 helicase-associated domain-containing protein [Polyangiaceae bacterium]